MAVLPPRAFRRASAYIRGLVVVYLVTLLCTSFAVPVLLHHEQQAAPRWTLLLPSCWFLGLCQSLHGRTNPALTELSRHVFPGIVAVLLVALCSYAVAYGRHFVRIGELAEAPATVHKGRSSHSESVFARLFLRTAFQKACFGFVWKTLFRSEAHRLVVTGIGGLGLVLASQALLNAFSGALPARSAALSPDALSVPFILTFLIIIGLRVVFEVPTELRSNWIFQLMVDSDRQESEPLARKIIMSVVLPLVLLLTFPAYVWLENLRIATFHMLLVGIWSVLLTNIVLARFRKLPFTCTFPVFKQHSIVVLLSFCFGYLIYAVSLPEFEASALKEPARMLEVLPFMALAWYIPHHLARSATEIERRLIFEETAPRTFEILRLGE